MRRHGPLLALVVVTTVYLVWVGSRWLPLGAGTGELDLFAARVADLRAWFAKDGALPWWTPTFMAGSSYALHHSQALYAVPWMALAPFTDIESAGKLSVLCEMAVAAVGMFFCARHFVKSEVAAAFAGVALLLHPQVFVRGCIYEHVNVAVALPTVPIVWLTLARLVERPDRRRVLACAVAFTAMLWAHNKLAAMHLVFVVMYVGFALLRGSPETRSRAALGLLAAGGLTALLAAFALVPAASELSLVKLFEGDPFDAWQKLYSLDAAQIAYRHGTNAEYLGLAEMALVALTLVVGGDRHRHVRAIFTALYGASLALGHGPRSVASATWASVSAEDATATTRAAVALALVALAAAVARAVLRETTVRTRCIKAITLAGAFAVFAFVPVFGLVSRLPLLGSIRAPSAFSELPMAVFGAILVATLVSELEARWGRRLLPVLAAAAVVLMADRACFDGRLVERAVSPATRAAFKAALAGASRDGGAGASLYPVTTRFLPTMSVAWGGPRLVTGMAWGFMAPRDSGQLAAEALSSLPAQRAYLDLLGVTHVLWDSGQVADPAGDVQLAIYKKVFKVAEENDALVLFRNAHARPRLSGFRRRALGVGRGTELAALSLALAPRGVLLVEEPSLARVSPSLYASVEHVYVTPSESAHLEGTTTEDRERVSIIGPSMALPPKATGAPQDPLAAVSFTRDHAHVLGARFEAKEPCTVVVSESYYPFWRGDLDGHEVPLMNVAHGLIGVPVPRGEHALTLTYRPPARYTLAFVVSALALALAVLAAILEKRKAPAS